MNIAVIGCGNMASPIVESMGTKFSYIKFYTYTPSKIRAKELARRVGGVYCESLGDFKDIDFWIIACKPQQLDDLSMELSGKLEGEKLISIMASVNIKKIERKLKTRKVIRVMPNTPSKIGEGISLFFSDSSVAEEDQLRVKELFESCGEVIDVFNEKAFEELTVFSGSGPAYIFKFAQAYFLKLQDMGYSRNISRKLLNQLFLGSSLLMKNSALGLDRMLEQVTSKAGVTIEAIDILEANSLNEIISSSIDAAVLRGEEISRL